MDHDYDPLFVLDHENQTYIWKTINRGTVVCLKGLKLYARTIGMVPSGKLTVCY